MEPRWRTAIIGAVGVLVATVIAIVAVGQHGPTPNHAAGLPAGALGWQAGEAPRATSYLAADGVRANWVQAENEKPGSPDWRISGPSTGVIQGFANQVYAAANQPVTLYVSTSAANFHVQAYRVGYYHGAGARMVWSSGTIPGKLQPPCPVARGINMVSCDNWTPSTTVTITPEFPPGDYLFKLVGDGNQQSFVPLTVWDPASHGTYLLKNDVFTWQAWNPYGGYDFYQGVGGCPPRVYPLCSRSRVVSYDRPYGDEQGTGDFLWLEAPLVRFMEEHGLDVSYTTDLTLVDHPETMANHKVLLSLGHDECWSLAERQAADTAHQHGLNIAFFGASGVLRHVRPQPSPLGPNRQVVDYRDSAADPLNGKGNPREVTGNTWSAPPASWPEADFVGEAYNGFLEPNVRADLTIPDASSWLFADSGLHNGSVLPGVIGSDVDSLEPNAGHPPDVQVLAHSALPATKAQPNTRQGPVFFSDMTYYTDPASKAGVWDSGTNNWIPALEAGPGEPPDAADAVQRITSNLFWLLGQGPSGVLRPSVPNWQQVYPGPARG